MGGFEGTSHQNRGAWISGLLSLILVFTLACGSSREKTAKPATAKAETAASSTSSKNQIREFHIQELDNATLITIEGAREPDFTVFKLNDPLRVVVDLANTELGDIAGPFAVNNGTVNEVNTTQFDDVTNSVARIIIGFDQIVDYEVVPEGTRLKINIQRIGAKPANAPEILVRSSTAPSENQTAAAVVPAAESTPAPFEPNAPAPDAAAAPIAPAGEEPAPLTAETGPKASQIIDVKVEPGADGTAKVTFTADGKIGDFSTAKLEDPARVVVDFPGLTSGYAKKRIKAPKPLKEIRLGSHSDKLRVVLDSRNAKKVPEVSSDLQQDRLVLTVGGSAPGQELPTAQPDVAAAPSTENAVEPAVEPLAPVGESKKVTGPIVKVGSLDFKQLPTASRLSIKVPDSVSYENLPFADGKVLIDLTGARLPKALQRSLDTSEFDSPVTLIRAYNRKGMDGTVRVEVSLREDVPVKVERDADAVHFDFERTRVFVAAAPAPAVKTAPAAAPAGESPGMEPLAASEEPSSAPSLEEPALTEPAAPAKGTSTNVGTVIGGSGVEAGGGLGGDDSLSSMPLGEAGEGGGGGQRFTGRRISLDFKDADIKNIFRLIAEVSKLNIVVGETVAGTITLRLINVPWDQALAIILQSKKLGIVRYDNILRIAPLKELEQERKEALSAKEAERDLEDLKILIIPVNYTKAVDLRGKIQNLLSKRGKLEIDTRTNTIIIEDIQQTLIKARSMVKTLDTATHQVIIDGRIVQASRNWQRSLGIQWGGSFVSSAATGNPTGLAFPATVGLGGGQAFTSSGNAITPQGPTAAAVPNYMVNLPSPGGEAGTLGINLGTLTGIGNLDARLGALESESKVRIISSPRVATLDNIAAKINQGAKIPFATTSSAGTQTTFVDATLELSVTPHVTNDRSIFLDLQLTNNSPGDASPAGPQINIAETKTQVLVKDGDTMVLGGVYVLNSLWNQTGIPWLRTIPVLNLLFANYSKTDDRRELLFFITPRIIAQNLTASN